MYVPSVVSIWMSIRLNCALVYMQHLSVFYKTFSSGEDVIESETTTHTERRSSTPVKVVGG